MKTFVNRYQFVIFVLLTFVLAGSPGTPASRPK